MLCIMPINTIQNWITEFNKWIPLGDSDVTPKKINLYALNDTRIEISEIVDAWAEDGGVLLVGYEMFRLLTKQNDCMDVVDEDNTIRLKMREALIDPGPDLVVCDEGHKIKNASAEISRALNEIRSKRRIVLTGYPLQNNLMEYWCMVNFVNPNYLRSKAEFLELFETPIKAGKFSDSTKEAIKLMNYRSYVLHTLLQPIVQRRSKTVLEKKLPNIYEYVIPLKMTSIQKDLYTAFENHILSTSIGNLLIMFAVASKIWNHPDILHDHITKRDNLDSEIGEIEDNYTKKRTIEMKFDWAMNSLQNFQPNLIENSAKMQIFECILNETLLLGDKVLLFSQSLMTLKLIERFLNTNIIMSTAEWKENSTYLRKNDNNTIIKTFVFKSLFDFIYRTRWLNFNETT